MRGLLLHAFTRLYFRDEAAANARDPVLAMVPTERRHLDRDARDSAAGADLPLRHPHAGAGRDRVLRRLTPRSASRLAEPPCQAPAYDPSARRLTFFDQARCFADGGDTPRKYLDVCLETIAAREPAVQAWVTTNVDGARAAADESGAR